MTAASLVAHTSPLAAFWASGDRFQRLALLLAAALALAALTAALISPFDPNAQSLISRLRPPLGFEGARPGHWLGTDELGRDLLSRCLHGLQLTLSLALMGATLGLLLGGMLGVLAGVAGKRIDAVIMAAVDTQIAIPFTLVALFMLSVFGSSLSVMADRVVVLAEGEKQEEGAVHDIFARPAAAYTQRLMAATPRLGSGAPKPVRPSVQVLEVRDLAVSFASGGGLLAGRGQTYHAVNGVSLRIGRGETLGLVGESGCGKSSLARAVLRLIEPADGRIRLAGTDITALPAADLRAQRRHAQIVFQDPFASLNPRLPVHKLITEPAVIHGRTGRGDSRAFAADLLEQVGLPRDALDRFPHQFSGGQRQRLCIARALSAGPDLIVADEAVSALDVSVARQITDLMARLQAETGVSFLFISHDIAVVERVSHRIAVMHAGQIVETGPTAGVLSRPMHPYTRRLLAAVPVPDPTQRGRYTDSAGQDEALPLGQLLPSGERPARHAYVEVSSGHFVATGSIGAKLAMLAERDEHIAPAGTAAAEHRDSTFNNLNGRRPVKAV